MGKPAVDYEALIEWFEAYAATSKRVATSYPPGSTEGDAWQAASRCIEAQSVAIRDLLARVEEMREAIAEYDSLLGKLEEASGVPMPANRAFLARHLTQGETDDPR